MRTLLTEKLAPSLPINEVVCLQLHDSTRLEQFILTRSPLACRRRNSTTGHRSASRTQKRRGIDVRMRTIDYGVVSECLELLNWMEREGDALMDQMRAHLGISGLTLNHSQLRTRTALYDTANCAHIHSKTNPSLVAAPVACAVISCRFLLCARWSKIQLSPRFLPISSRAVHYSICTGILIRLQHESAFTRNYETLRYSQMKRKTSITVHPYTRLYLYFTTA